MFDRELILSFKVDQEHAKFAPPPPGLFRHQVQHDGRVFARAEAQIDALALIESNSDPFSGGIKNGNTSCSLALRKPTRCECSRSHREIASIATPFASDCSCGVNCHQASRVAVSVAPHSIAHDVCPKNARLFRALSLMCTAAVIGHSLATRLHAVEKRSLSLKRLSLAKIISLVHVGRYIPFSQHSHVR